MRHIKYVKPIELDHAEVPDAPSDLQLKLYDGGPM